MNDSSQVTDKFRIFAATALSALLGLLITIPLSQDTMPYIPLVGAVAGLLVGLRRNKSQAFFFFVLIACGIMTSLLLGQLSLQ